MMKQVQFYKYAALALLVLNISMLTFFVLTQPAPRPRQGHPPREDNERKRAVDIMNLDEQQHEAFMDFADIHTRKIDALNNQQRELLKPYFNRLINSNNEPDSDSLLNRLQELERAKIELTYQHFQDIKSIIRPEQEAGYEEFISNIINHTLVEQKNNPPPPQDF